MSTNLLDWALPRLKRLLPLDDESLTEILSYTTTLTKETGAAHLQNVLGDSPQALDFISNFNSRRQEVTPPKSTQVPVQSNDSDRVPRSTRKQVKSRAPLHNAGPVRRPEGFGDTSGAYTRRDQDEPFRGHKKGPSSSSLSEVLSLSQTPDALQLPQVTQGVLHTPISDRSRDPSPALRSKPPPSAAGPLISDLPNVRQKQSKKPAPHSPSVSGTSTPSRSKTSTVTSVNDLTAAIAALELSTNPSLSRERRNCTCNASIHPLFTTAPNCLNCGKIICALEGLQPCSSCDAPILTRDQVNEMIRILKSDRSVEKIATHNAHISGRATPLMSDSSGDEAGTAATRARQHRDKLLAFQRENAQRTRVHDEAADYDMTLTPGATQWMNPVQRATALKKQQQYMRELQESARPEYEKRQTVMSLSVKNGKLMRTYERQATPSTTLRPEETEEIIEEEHRRDETREKLGGSGRFSENPLMASGGLIRPVWKPSDAEASRRREKKSVWRRVQDDNEDNERYILDGGLYGHSDVAKTRIMEDGSQQECG